MKSGRVRVMNGSGQEIGIELDSSIDMGGTPQGGEYSTSGLQNSRRHSRSQSWSFNSHGQRTGAGDLTSSLAALNPITSVIREIVPSFGENSSSSSATSPLSSRVASQASMHPLSTGIRFGSDSDASDSSSSHAPHPHRTSAGVGGGGGGGRGIPSAEGERASAGERGGVAANTNEEQPQQQNIGFEISDGVRWLEHNAIFIILLLLKFAWYHRSGLMVILGMLGTYLHCNQTIRNQVSLKNRREKSVLTLVVLFLAGNIYFVYYVFREQQLHNCLIFKSPTFGIDLWNLLWSICVTDYIVRFGTMALKAIVAGCFLFLLPSRKKGKYYMLLEFLSQFYRNLLPLPLWFRYLSNSHHSGAVFAIIITAAYLMIKGGVTLARIRDLYRAFIDFIQDPTYGTTPTKEELLRSSNTCPICQESFEQPVMLKCRHIFCEDCVLQWFDRQSTCPLCRSTIASDPKWRDGSTAAWPNLF